MEELVTDPLEDAIAEIAEVDTIESKSMVGISIIKVTTEDQVTNTDQAWDEVRAKVLPVQQTLPRGTAPPFVFSDFGDVYPVCFALYQSPMPEHDTIEYSPRQLEIFAEKIEEELELLDSVARVDFWGVQPERIYVEADSADWAKIGLTLTQLRSLFEARNIVEPGGELDTERGRYAVNPTGEFTSVEQMNDLVVGRFDGEAPIHLGDMPIRIDRRYEEPPRSLSRFTSPTSPHREGLVIGFSMKGGRNVVAMGEAIDQAIKRLQQSELPPDLTLTPMNDLPRQVNTRILGFRDNLLQGVLIVLVVALVMVSIFKETKGVVFPQSDWGSDGYYAEVGIDPNAASLAGVTNVDVALNTKTTLSGTQLTTYREGDHLVPVLLRTHREHRENLSDLSGIFVNGASGKVPLNSIATVVPTWEPAVIARKDNVPTVTVGSRVAEGELSNIVAARIKPKLDEMMNSLPPGYRLAPGGEYEETKQAQVQVVRAVLIAILMIVLVLIVQYNSFLKSLVILFTVPLALIGVLIGLLVTGWAMGFMANLGILALIGIVINNAIVLIDFIESRVADGQELRSAVAEAGRLRLRPIVLTSLTTVGGLLPLSLFGGALWAPMTNGMIFGLICSTVLTLVVVPTLYVLFAERFGMKVV